MNSSRHIIVFSIFSLFFFTSCSDKEQNSENKLVKVEEIDQFNAFIDEFPFIDQQSIKAAKDSCRSFYESRKFAKVWFDEDSLSQSNELTSFFNYVTNDTLLNIIPNLYPVKKVPENAVSWLREMYVYFRISYYLSSRETGIFDFENKKINTVGLSANQAIDSFINAKPINKDWSAHLVEYNTINKEISRLHYALNEFTKNRKITDKTCEQDSSENIDNLKECLHYQGYIALDSSQQLTQLKRFQYENGLNPDGVIGARTIKALMRSNFTKYLEGIITLDHLRQFADSLLPNKWIKVNIPTFEVTLYNADTVAFNSRVIVGKNKTKTPVFQSKVAYAVTNPYWNVPYSIATKEIIYSIKRDTSIFRKKGYEILLNNEVINHDTIDWSRYNRYNFPFRIRQIHGPLNSLGKIKLIFPNRYAVYIHDTPGKYLFNTEKRTYSHGCIRTEFADSLVKTIMKLENHAYLDSLDSLYNRDQETYLRFRDRFLVSIEYQTVTIDESDGRVRFFEDIYGRLTDFIKIVKLQSP